MSLFIKAVLGGLTAVVVVWIVMVAIAYARLPSSGGGGLGSVAGGWDVLLRSPAVVFLLSAAFGIGFWIVTRLLSTS